MPWSAQACEDRIFAIMVRDRRYKRGLSGDHMPHMLRHRKDRIRKKWCRRLARRIASATVALWEAQ